MQALHDDLLIECVCCGIGLFWVKCPLSYKTINPQELALLPVDKSGLKKKAHTQISTIHKCRDNLVYVVTGAIVIL